MIEASAYSAGFRGRADRNPIDLYADAGVEFIGLCEKRPDDKLGIAAGYAHISKRVQQLDRTTGQ
jgi:porin